LDLSEDILGRIDLSKEVLDDLVAEGDEPDEYYGKDMQFHRVNLRPDWQEMDPDELSEEYISEDEVDYAMEPEVVYDEENPRRSRRNQKK
jgi:hypothetical protein